MNDLLKTGLKTLNDFQRTRTGWLGLGPTYGQIIVYAAIEYAMRRHEKRDVVREAEKVLDEINQRNRWL